MNLTRNSDNNQVIMSGKCERCEENNISVTKHVSLNQKLCKGCLNIGLLKLRILRVKELFNLILKDELESNKLEDILKKVETFLQKEHDGRKG